MSCLLYTSKQQARQLEYIRKVLEEKLSVHDPLILPYSALPVINGTGTEYIEGNRETEERILKFLQEQRIRIQLQRCMALSENAMGRLKESLSLIHILNGISSNKGGGSCVSQK